MLPEASRLPPGLRSSVMRTACQSQPVLSIIGEASLLEIDLASDSILQVVGGHQTVVLVSKA